MATNSTAYLVLPHILVHPTDMSLCFLTFIATTTTLSTLPRSSTASSAV